MDLAPEGESYFGVATEGTVALSDKDCMNVQKTKGIMRKNQFPST